MSFKVQRGNILNRPIANVNNAIDTNTDFKKVLEGTLKTNKDIKISAHAEQRMVERGISLRQRDMDLISQGMDKLEKKGGKESLMLYKDMAFIASVTNRTIITAMGEKEVDTVTNIDSMVIIK